MRYSGSLFDIGDPLAEHEAVLRRRGSVWLGKFGRGLAHSRIDAMNRRAAQGGVVSLYLASKPGRSWVVHRARIAEVARELPDGGGALVPPYYFEHQLLGNVGFWSRVTQLEPVSQQVLDRLSLVSSGSTARQALTYSMNGMFIVGTSA